MNIIPLVLTVSMLVACSGKGDDSGDADTYSGIDTANSQTCAGEAPVITGIRCENTGLQEHFETGELIPTMRLWTEVSDSDGDLNRYQLEIYYDETVDGAVDTT